MKETNLRFQIGLFGSLEDISPSTDTLKFLIDEFGYLELIPSIYEETEIPPGETRIIFPSSAPSRISLKSSDNLWSVNIGLKRIDIQKLGDRIDSNIGQLHEFVANFEEILSKFEKRFSRKYHRLTLITSRFFSGISDEDFSKISKNLFNLIDIYQEHPPVEFQERLVTRISSDFKDGEVLNVISTANRGTANFRNDLDIEPVEGLQIVFDINTFQGSTDYRFDANDAISFAKKTSELDEILIDAYRKMVA